MDDKILNLEEYINNEKFVDAESRKHLLELIKDAFVSINTGIKILYNSFDVFEKDSNNGDCTKIYNKQIDIARHMVTAVDELDQVFAILKELIEEKRKAEEMMK